MTAPLLDVAEASDRDLLAAHCAGHPEAFGELFRRHRDRMWAVAVRTVGDRELAADAVQEAFLSAFRRADSFRGESAVTTWLHRIVVNACLDRLRRLKPVVELDEVRAGRLADPRDATSEVDTALLVRDALRQLPEGQRMALVLVDMQGLSVLDAAEVLGVAEGTIKSRCARGRAALAAILAPRGLPVRVPEGAALTGEAAGPGPAAEGTSGDPRTSKPLDGRTTPPAEGGSAPSPPQPPREER